jgi:hypothetical protein
MCCPGINILQKKKWSKNRLTRLIKRYSFGYRVFAYLSVNPRKPTPSKTIGFEGNGELGVDCTDLTH